jgi:hypothetical protein
VRRRPTSSDLENTVDQWPHIRRLADGAIDYDFYRRKARDQRSAAIGDFFRLRKRERLGIVLTFLARLRAAWRS